MHLKAIRDDTKLKLILHYETQKTKSLFTKKKKKKKKTINIKSISEGHNVVYRWTCERDDCNSTPQSYIWLYMFTVKKHFRTQTHQSSSIKKHLQDVHGIDRVTTTAALVQGVEILRSAADRRDLLYGESLLIKSWQPGLS